MDIKQKLFLGFLGTGSLPKPGISASLVAIVTGVFILRTLGMETLFMLTLVATVIGIFELNKYVAQVPDSTYDEITIDDASGMWLSLMIALSTAFTIDLPYIEWFTLLLAFASFMLFQHWKPSTIGWMYHTLKGGLGIILSSILSGIAGGLLSVVILMGIGRFL